MSSHASHTLKASSDRSMALITDIRRSKNVTQLGNIRLNTKLKYTKNVKLEYTKKGEGITTVKEGSKYSASA